MNQSTIEYENSIIKGIFLLILAVSGNFVAEVLGCKTQRLLSNNMLAKHSIIFMILFFTINFVDSGEQKHPGTIFKIALCIHIMMLLFTKMNIYFTIICFIILFTIYVSFVYIDFYKKDEKKYKNEIKQIREFQPTLYKLFFVLLIIGFVLYFRKQYTDYYDKWSTFNFIFGVTKCKSMR